MSPINLVWIYDLTLGQRSPLAKENQVGAKRNPGRPGDRQLVRFPDWRIVYPGNIQNGGCFDFLRVEKRNHAQ